MEGKGLSRLEMGLAVLTVVMVVVAGMTTALLLEERGESKEVEAGEGIDEVAFVREGVVIELDQDEDVDTVTVYDSTGTELSKMDVGRTTGRVLADLEWTPHMKYRFDITLASGDVLSSPSFAPEKAVPYKLFEISYAEEFPVEEYHASVSAHSHTEAVVTFSPDGTRIAVGGLEGRASVIDISTESETWKTTIDQLSIESVRWSDDGKYVYFGGHHLDYKFFCLDAATGDVVWDESVKSEVGETPQASAPATWVWSQDDKVWTAISASWTEVDEAEETRSYITEPLNTSRTLHYRSKIFCYDYDSGDRIWDFPADGSDYDDWDGGVMDRGLMHDSLMVDENGKYLSIAFSSRNGDTKHFDAQLVVFDAQTGAMKWNWSMPILEISTIYRSHITNAWMSRDGKWIAVGSHDGRGYLFDNEKNVANGVGAPEWERNLGSPVIIGTLLTHTSDICPYTDGENVIFHIARTQDETNAHGNSMDTKVYGEWNHLCLDMDGGKKWSFKIGETRAYTGTGRYGFGEGGGYWTFANEHQEITSLSQDSSTLYYTHTIHPTRTESYFTCMDLNDGSYDGYTHMEWRVRLDGSPATQGDVSEDGWYVCIAESPVDKDPTGSNPDYHGVYRVMVYV